jgi:ribosomal protein S18 acetylase RimI-like enzyme
MPESLELRRASAADAGRILPMMRRYYDEDRYPFDPARAEAALLALLGDERLGEAWLALDRDAPLGYVVLCLGWSLEHQGRDAFVDELFVEPAARGHGVGRRLMHLAVERCRALGVRSLHLEVERTNAKAQALYASLGFRGTDRVLMSKRLAP